MAILHSALVADKEMVEHHGHCWDAVMRDGWGAVPSSPVDGVDAAISAWTANLCGETRGEELSLEEERKYAPPVSVVQQRELADWEEFHACRSVAQAAIKKAITGTSCVLAWRVADGNTPAKACF